MEFLFNILKQVSYENPDKISVKCNGKSYTYLNLYESSISLLNNLFDDINFKKSDLICIILDKNYHYIISILACIFSGKPFVSFNTKNPITYNQNLINPDNSIIISTKNIINSFDHAYQSRVLLLDNAIRKLNFSLASNIKLIHNNIVYYIYTSGTTGNPKLIPISSFSIINLLQYQSIEYPITESSNILNFSPISFDVCMSEILGAIFSKSTLTIIDDNLKKDPSYLADFIEKNKISIIKTTPEVLIHLQEKLYSSLKTIIIGGDVSTKLNLSFWATNYKLINEYGCTETCVAATKKTLTQYTDVNNIGKAIQNTQTYLINENNELTNDEGELCISGAPVSVALADLYPNNFLHLKLNNTKNSVLLYKTGDYVKKLPDGDILFIERKDSILKVRGYRIDPNYIKKITNLPYFLETFVHYYKSTKLLNLYCKLKPSYLISEKFSEYKKTTNSWKIKFDHYFKSNHKISLFDTISGNYLIDHEINDWLENISHALINRKKLRVLDIGCGNGLILHRYHRHFLKYTGIDQSTNAISICKKSYGHIANCDISFYTAEILSYLNKKVNNQYDLIVLNSVFQYLPNEEYISTLIQLCSKILSDTGSIIISDVRNYLTYENYIQRKHTVNKRYLSSEDFIREASLARSLESELLVSPSYFIKIASKNRFIKNIVLLNKHGNTPNEYNLFRYDVILSMENGTHLNQNTLFEWPFNLPENLESYPNGLVIKGIPNTKINPADIYATEVNLEEYLLKLKIYQKKHALIEKYIINEYPDQSYFDLYLMKKRKFNINKLPHYTNFPLPTSEKRYHLTNDPLLITYYTDLKIKLKNEIHTYLPDYMTPNNIIFLTDFPKTNHGKIDIDALPMHQYISSKSASEFTADNLSYKVKAIKDIWEDLLSIHSISVNDRFFEIGGDSITCIQFISRVKQKGLFISYQDVYDYPKLIDLAKVSTYEERKIESSSTSNLKIPLTSMMHWFFTVCSANVVGFGQTIALKLRNNIDISHLKNTLHIIIKNDPIFKLRFNKSFSSAYITNKEIFSSDYFYSKNNLDEINLENALEENLFDLNLNNGPLIKFIFIKNKHVLLISAHHTIIDGISWRLLLDKIEKLYFSPENETYDHCGSNYFDWILSRDKYLFSNDQLKNETCYWERLLVRASKYNFLLHENPTPATFIKHYYTSIENMAWLYSDIHSYRHTQVNDLLISAFRIALSQFTNLEKILIEVESHGRQDFTVNLDISSALGWFTAIYPLFFIKNNSDYLQAMIKTKESIRESPRNGIGYSYIRENKLKQLMNTNIAFGFNYLGRYLIDNSKIFLGFDNAIQLHGVPVSFFDFISNKNKFPHKIKLTCWHENNILYYYFSYDSMLYTPKEIKELSKKFNENILSIEKAIKNL